MVNTWFDRLAGDAGLGSALLVGSDQSIWIGELDGQIPRLRNRQGVGVVWHAPFVRDITSALRPGENSLELAVVNTWFNRLAGDERYPADFEWGQDRGPAMGHAMKAYPDWFLRGASRPSQDRQGFVIWYYHRSDTPLIPSGLLGPVTLQPVAVQEWRP